MPLEPRPCVCGKEGDTCTKTILVPLSAGGEFTVRTCDDSCPLEVAKQCRELREKQFVSEAQIRHAEEHKRTQLMNIIGWTGTVV